MDGQTDIQMDGRIDAKGYDNTPSAKYSRGVKTTVKFPHTLYF